MATINLGAIKFNWKGAYNSSTTYAVDDVVSSSGNSYVCIQAHSNQAVGDATAYWNIMSAKGTNGTNGTNGTDISTTLTAQGDMLYRDGSGLQKLAKGTAGQDLRMNSSANAPEWYTPSSAGGVVSTGGFSGGQNIFLYNFDNQTTTSTDYPNSSAIAGSEWDLGSTLTSAKTCIFNYSVISYEPDWNHTFIRFYVSTNDGGSYNNIVSSEFVHDAEFENSSSSQYTTRRTGFFTYDFASGATPRFKMEGGHYGSSNPLKINYDAGNDGTAKSYYQAWFV